MLKRNLIIVIINYTGMFNMSGELESGKSGNVIMGYIYCPEENDIARRLCSLNS